MKNKPSSHSDETICTHGGRDPAHHLVVNPPVYRGSTIVFKTYEEYVDSHNILSGEGLTYAVHGTPSSYAFEDALTQLEDGYRTRLCQSGMTACIAPLLSYLGAGDHLLVTDSIYGPMRSFCSTMLKRFGIETTFYEPTIGAAIKELIQPNTRMIYLESPGSWTFEVQDIPAITDVVKQHNCLSVIDNTWATPLYFKPLKHGVDISVQAITKYVSGHSDLLMGSVTTTKDAYPKLRDGWRNLGLCAAADDIFLAARGLRTLPQRMEIHYKNGLRVAEWLSSRQEVQCIIHPALKENQGHDLWKRDFLGASGLFGFVLQPEFSEPAKLGRLLDHMSLFSMGFSWGGFESLLIPIAPKKIRRFWPRPNIPTDGQFMRIHIGLENVDDLIGDLEQGFMRLRM